MQNKQTRAALGRHQRSRMPSKSAFGNASFTAHPNPPAAARYLILFSLAIHAANAAPRFSPSPSRTCGSIVDFSSIAAKTASAVVTIRSEKLLSYPYFWPKSLKQLLPESPDLYIWSGSGVIVDSRGYILTNLHVVEGTPHVRVRLPSHRDVEPMFIAKDPHTDLAVLKVKAQALPFIPLGNSDDLRVGEWVLAIGSPFDAVEDFVRFAQSRKGKKPLLLLVRNGSGEKLAAIKVR